MSMPIETGIARRVRPKITATDELGTLLRVWGVNTPDDRALLADAYEHSLLYGEHTWGFSRRFYEPRVYGEEWMTKWKSGVYARTEESWAEHGNYIRHAQQIIEPALHEMMNALAAAVSMEGPRIIVFNPLPWKRDEVVTVEGHPEFLARDVPAMGYRAYPLESKKTDEPPTPAIDKFENPFFRLKLDPDRGGI